jgi:hypothetical protein
VLADDSGQSVTVDEALREAVRKEFGDRADEVVGLLALYESDGDHPEASRLQRAVIALSDSNVELVRHFVERARRDHRDVLWWAEYRPDPDDPKTYQELRRRLGLGTEPDGP